MSLPATRTQGNRGSAPRSPNKPQAGGQAKIPPRTTWMTFLFILILNYILVSVLLPAPGAPVTIPYTIFKEQVEQGNVTAIYSKGTSIEGRFAKPFTWPAPGEKKAPSPLERW